ncbi:MAG: hypothetical protein WCW84_06770 [Sulfurimonas sp.]|jgi:hypothetical protein
MTPIQVITIEMENKTVRVMVENTLPSLYRAYYSYKFDERYEPFVYSGIEDSDPLALLRDCRDALTSRQGDVVGGDNQISDIYKHDDIENILGVKVTKS